MPSRQTDGKLVSNLLPLDHGSAGIQRGFAPTIVDCETEGNYAGSRRNPRIIHAGSRRANQAKQDHAPSAHRITPLLHTLPTPGYEAHTISDQDPGKRQPGSIAEKSPEQADPEKSQRRDSEGNPDSPSAP